MGLVLVSQPHRMRQEEKLDRGVSKKIAVIRPKRFGKSDASLREFLDWYMQHSNVLPQSPYDGLTFVGNGPALALFREGPFQVQLFLCVPNTLIPKHSHPHVESFEINVSGDVDFYVENKPTYPEGAGSLERNGLPRLWGYGAYVGAGVIHHAVIGPKGGAFLSVQKWLQGTPTSVDEDWEGSAMTAAHLQLLDHALHRRLPEAIKDTHQPYVAGQLCD